MYSNANLTPILPRDTGSKKIIFEQEEEIQIPTGKILISFYAVLRKVEII